SRCSARARPGRRGGAGRPPSRPAGSAYGSGENDSGRPERAGRVFRARPCVSEDSVDDRGGLLDRLDDLADLEGLLEEGVEAGALELGGLPVGELAAHRDDAGHLELFAAADEGGDVAGVVVLA